MSACTRRLTLMLKEGRRETTVTPQTDLDRFWARPTSLALGLIIDIHDIDINVESLMDRGIRYLKTKVFYWIFDSKISLTRDQIHRYLHYLKIFERT